MGRDLIRWMALAGLSLSLNGAAFASGGFAYGAPGEATETEEVTEGTSYRVQVLAMDAGSFVTFLFAPGAGLLAFHVGAPAIHMAKGESGNAAKSLGLRLGLPLLFAGGYGLVASPKGEDNVGGLLAGWVIGMGVASVVDASKLAHTTPEPQVQPVVGVRDGGFTLGLAGTF